MMVICGYCGDAAKMAKGSEVYPHLSQVAANNYWVCDPCDARVGCHQRNDKHGVKGTEPLGILANAELRKARTAAHRSFDQLWKSNRMTRSAAYKYLSQRMGLHPDDCHIGLFNAQQCCQVCRIAEAVTEHINP